MRGSRGYHRLVLGRRDVLLGLGAAAIGCGRARSCGSAGAPEAPWGVQSGDVTDSRAVVWCRADRPSRMTVDWSTSPAFADARRLAGPQVSPDGDLCGKVALDGLPSGTRIHYRARFEGERAGEWVAGSFATAPTDERDVLFAWSGDTNGQGWGIDNARGGMPAYKAVLDRRPDFFVHAGDHIYADNPILEAVPLEDGTVWRNVTTPAKSHPAETLDDFRGAFLYPRHSAEVRALYGAVPVIWTWDDHEVRDNWFPGQIHRDERYRERRIDVLSAFARRAMFEHMPTVRPPEALIYRSVRWGPHLELFVVDGRSYRTPNYPRPSVEAFFGAEQTSWLERSIAASTATWKVVVCDQPVGLFLEDRTPEGTYEPEGIGKENGPPAGREVELARLLSGLKARRARNVVWITADVHYAAAHRYDPEKAIFRDMDPFWEFIAGPMHATAFNRKRGDDTFGLEVAYVSMEGTRFGSPATGEQFFGTVRIDGKTRAMTVTLVDMAGRDLYSTTLAAT